MKKLQMRSAGNAVARADSTVGCLFEHSPSHASAIDVLDYVLDKGIVIDAWVRVSVVGIDLLTIEARVIVASIETYLKHAGTLSDVAARPA